MSDNKSDIENLLILTCNILPNQDYDSDSYFSSHDFFAMIFNSPTKYQYVSIVKSYSKSQLEINTILTRAARS